MTRLTADDFQDLERDAALLLDFIRTGNLQPPCMTIHPATVLALIERVRVAEMQAQDMLRNGLEDSKRISELETERAINHKRLAANERFVTELVSRVDVLEQELREACDLLGKLEYGPGAQPLQHRVAELRKLVEPVESRCRLHFLDTDRWARCNLPRLHDGECR